MKHEEPKRLYKSEKNKVFAGVCGGIGEYANIDPVVVRLLWTLLSFFTGIVPGIVAYIVSALIIPKKLEAE